ncbi:MAG: hypothetical protein J0M04_18130 [Verrucomicrobia bacterium]|nr:hypothetical protein [Verrucomicrobiota bacterium]
MAAEGAVAGKTGDRRARSGRWWLLSFGFHAVLLGWLLGLSPEREIGRGTDRASRQVGAGRAREMAGRIREQQAVPFARSVHELQEIARKLAETERVAREDYRSVSRGLAGDAPARLDALFSQIGIAHKNALASLEAAERAFSGWREHRTSVSFDEAAEAQRACRGFQVAAANTQERIEALLSITDARFGEALLLQRHAAEAQAAASDALVAAEEVRDRARWSRPASKHEREMEHYAYHVRRTSRLIRDEEKLLAESAGKVAAAESESARASADSEAGLWAGKNLASARRKHDALVKDIADAKSEYPSLELKLAELSRQEDPGHPLPTTDDVEAMAALRKALGIQRDAADLQRAVSKLCEEASERPVPPPSATPESTDPPVPEVTPESDLARKNVAALYQLARATERELTESFRRKRATELAMLRQIPLDRALALTDVSRPMRPDLDGALRQPVDGGPAAVAVREAVETARDEITSMVQLAQMLLDQAADSARENGATISMDDYQAMLARTERLENLAAESEGIGSVDLTGAMSGDRDGFGEGPPGGNSGAPGEGNGFGGDGGGAESWGSEGGPGVAAGSGAITGWPARKVIPAGGVSVPWFYLDSWYVIGPFDNTRRANVDKKFPPESTIDLNAVYPGKNGVPIRWEFQQSGSPNIMPRFAAFNAASKHPGLDAEQNFRRNLEYVIYYAYTEVRFEQDTDLWISIGSDDHSRIWINDQPVWASGRNLKAWKISEGRRKVRFKQGVNRVLCRIENGNSRTEFSVVLHLK